MADDEAALVWHEIKHSGEEPSPRIGHSASIINNNVYIFGGCARTVTSRAERIGADGITAKLSPGFASDELFQARVDGVGCTSVWKKISADGNAPCGRWKHTATAAGTKMFVFGGMVDDRQRLNDLYLYATDTNEWRDPKPRGTVPAPRSCHTTTYVEEMDKLLVYGGYGGDGRLFPDVEAFHVGTLTWAPLPTKGAMPVARFDHSTSLAGKKLVICGGRNCEAPVLDINVLDVETCTWEILQTAGTPPTPLYSHVACAIPSAISHKLFIFGGLEGQFKYKSTVYAIDTNVLSWNEPKVETDVENGMVALPTGREGAAHVFDNRSGHVFFFGGWNSTRLSSTLSLDCTGIVGPPYAAQGVEPKLGPLSGGRPLIVKGLNFINGKTEVKFTNKDEEVIVSGKFVDDTTISCTTPSFEAHGAQTIQIKVAINGQLFTVNRVNYDYFDDAKAEFCVAYGPGLNSCTAGKPAKFIVRSIDTKKMRRTSGADKFEVVAVWNKGQDNEKKFKGWIEDHDDGLYTMTYIPKAAGDYHIQVFLANSEKKQEIRGSPFQVSASNPWKNAPIGGSTPIGPSDGRAEIISGPNLFTVAPNPKDRGAVKIFDSKAKSWAEQEMNPKAKAPKPVEAASEVLAGEDRMVRFGGLGRTGEPCNTISTLVKDGDIWDWTEPMITGTAPAARQGHASVTHKKMMLVSGGEVKGATEATLDMHMLDLDQGMSVVEWMPVGSVSGEVPTARTQHAMYSDGSKVFVFGGLLQEASEAEEEPAVAEEEEPAAEEGCCRGSGEGDS